MFFHFQAKTTTENQMKEEPPSGGGWSKKGSSILWNRVNAKQKKEKRKKREEELISSQVSRINQFYLFPSIFHFEDRFGGDNLESLSTMRHFGEISMLWFLKDFLIDGGRKDRARRWRESLYLQVHHLYTYSTYLLFVSFLFVCRTIYQHFNEAKNIPFILLSEIFHRVFKKFKLNSLS